MKEINRENIRILRDDIEAALIVVATNHGVTIETGKCTFSVNSCEFKVQVAVVHDGVSLTPEVERFKKYAGTLGLKPEHLGTHFVFKCQGYKIGGLKPDIYSKYPVNCIRDDGKGFAFGLDLIKKLLGI